MFMKIRNLIVLLRPREYTKNLFIFLPTFFAGQLLNASLLLNDFIAFIAFSCAASSIYILNDYNFEMETSYKFNSLKLMIIFSFQFLFSLAIFKMAH